MTVFARILGSAMLWGTTLYIVSETVRGGSDHVPRRRYLIYGFLMLGAPAVGAALLISLLGDSKLVIILASAISVAICWPLAIVLNLRWQRVDRERALEAGTSAPPVRSDPAGDGLGSVDGAKHGPGPMP
jgi:MFS family permease